ncbi:MAG: hypothetical protein U0234_29225 [Sandaracinus sp.]
MSAKKQASALAPHVIEALAHDRLDLLSPAERAEIEVVRESDGDALERLVTSEREGSLSFSRALPRAVDDDFDVDALVSSAMARAETKAERASSRTLAIGATLGVLFAAVSGSLALASEGGGTLDAFRHAASLTRAGMTLTLATGRALEGAPGGVAGVVLALLAIVAGLVWLGRRGEMRGALPLLAIAALAPGSAHAYELDGALPADGVVHVDVEHTPRSVALSAAARSAGLGLVYMLPEDPEVTLHADGVPLAEVLAALVPGEATIHATPHLLTITPADPTPASPTADVPAPVQASAPPTPPAPPALPPIAPSAAAPAPPAPPAPPVRAPVPTRSIELQDLLTFGQDAHVAADQEVRDVLTMGGDATIDGRTYGSVVTMGGDADVSGVVVGDVVTMGGDIHVRDHGVVHGRLDSLGGRVQVDGGSSAMTPGAPPAVAIGGPPPWAAHDEGDGDGGFGFAVLRYSLLFLASILFLGLAPERFARVQRAVVERPVRTLAAGILGVLASAIVMVALCVSLVGIPVAIVLAILSPLALAAALAVIVPVLGAMLPIRALEGRPVARLAAGALTLFVVTRIPVVGGIAIMLALLAGLGALAVTRFGGRDAGEHGM